MPSSQTTLSPKNIIRSIRERDHQRHSSESDWGFAPPNDVAFLPSEWRDINVLPSPAVAAANLLLPDVIKGCRSSEWRRRPFLGFPLPLSGGQGDTLGLQHCPDAAWVGQRLMPGLSGGGGVCTRKHSQWIKKLFLSPSFGSALEDTPWMWEGNRLCPHRSPSETKPREPKEFCCGVIEN